MVGLRSLRGPGHHDQVEPGGLPVLLAATQVKPRQGSRRGREEEGLRASTTRDGSRTPTTCADSSLPSRQVDEVCEKCGEKQMSVKTMQLRSAGASSRCSSARATLCVLTGPRSPPSRTADEGGAPALSFSRPSSRARGRSLTLPARQQPLCSTRARSADGRRASTTRFSFAPVLPLPCCTPSPPTPATALSSSSRSLWSQARPRELCLARA